MSTIVQLRVVQNSKGVSHSVNWHKMHDIGRRQHSGLALMDGYGLNRCGFSKLLNLHMYSHGYSVNSLKVPGQRAKLNTACEACADSRLCPATLAMIKQLLRVYDKNTPHFNKLPGDGDHWGANAWFCVQSTKDGLARTFTQAERFQELPM